MCSTHNREKSYSNIISAGGEDRKKEVRNSERNMCTNTKGEGEILKRERVCVIFFF